MNEPLIRRGVAAVAATLALVLPSAALADPSAQVRWYGDTSSATGAALGAGDCDFNGDGYADAVTGAWFWDKAPNNNVGAAYILWGDEQVAGGDLNTPGPAGATRIDGPSTANAFVGFSVACVGDVNGDAIDDLAISHYVAEKAYLVLGAEEFGSIDLGLLGDRGFELQGDATEALDYNVGFSMAAAGDVNDDGLDDIAIAGVVADTRGRTNNGRVWIVAGKEGVADVDLIAPEPGEVLQTIDGAGSEDRLGAIAPAGDVNGDGVDDLVLGAYTATPWGAGVAVPGSAWVVFGGSAAELDLAAIGEAGFAIRGPQRGRDRLGISVAGAGDVNGDGLDDVIVGGDGVYNAATGQRPGSAWVVFGADSSAEVLTDTAGDPAVYDCVDTDADTVCDADEKAVRGYWIVGADSDPGTGSESTGYSLAGIGDVSGDDVPDFAIGAYGYDPANPASPETTMAGAGAVWVVHGKPGTSTQQLATLSAADGYRIDGLAAGDRFGRQVAGLGDLDSNGDRDFAAGGDFAQRPLPPETPRSQAGEVTLALLGPLATRIALDVAPAGAVAPGIGVDLTATVAKLAAGGGPVGVGTVAFTADGVPIAGCQAVTVDADGVASCGDVSFDRYGSHQLSASYSGAAGLAGSVAEPLAQLVEESSTTTLRTSANPGAAAAELTLTAGVISDASATAPGQGSVDFTVDGATLCLDVPVSAGAATCAATFAAAGSFSVTAEYSGVPGLAGSSAAINQLIEASPVPPSEPTPPASGDGTPSADQLFGTGAADTLRGFAGADKLRGRAGDDTIRGGDGDDDLRGGDGDDALDGGAGRDRLDGGRGDDSLTGGPGVDLLDCGPGDDRAEAGRRDRVRDNCETVTG